MLEFGDIQHILLTRTPAITGRYEFLAFDKPAGGRAWLSELLDKVQSAADVQATMDSSDRWVTLAFTWNGLRALGVPEQSLASFPDEFREGMAARAGILGDTGAAAPVHWVGGLAGEDLHAIAILFSRTDEQCRRSIEEHDKLLARTDGVRSVSYLDLNATPPFNYAHDHFGFRDRLSQPVMKGSGEEPTPGSGAALEPGEFILGYPDEDGPVANLPEPEVLSRNGSYMAYRRLQEHVGLFRDYLREHADTPAGQELLAAKFMGRWRSGAPLVLAPEKDDPKLGADPLRNNDYNYKEMDPFGYACPLGSHARRLNPRDTAHYMNRRRMYNPRGQNRFRRNRPLGDGLSLPREDRRLCRSVLHPLHRDSNPQDPHLSRSVVLRRHDKVGVSQWPGSGRNNPRLNRWQLRRRSCAGWPVSRSVPRADNALAVAHKAGCAAQNLLATLIGKAQIGRSGR
jgi:deferrochelatase/peroxidase EfeB